jgi:hypothetical protein
MSDDEGIPAPNWENARNALAYLNAQLMEEGSEDDSLMSVDFVVGLMNDDPTPQSKKHDVQARRRIDDCREDPDSHVVQRNTVVARRNHRRARPVVRSQ